MFYAKFIILFHESVFNNRLIKKFELIEIIFILFEICWNNHMDQTTKKMKIKKVERAKTKKMSAFGEKVKGRIPKYSLVSFKKILEHFNLKKL